MIPSKYKNKIIQKIIYVKIHNTVPVNIVITVNFEAIELVIDTKEPRIFAEIVKEISSKNSYKTFSHALKFPYKKWYIAKNPGLTPVYKKNMSGIPSGLFNLVAGSANLIAKEIAEFVDTNIPGAQVLSAENVELLAKKQIIDFYQEKRTLRDTLRDPRAQVKIKSDKKKHIWPKYKPEYSAEYWKELSQKAWEYQQLEKKAKDCKPLVSANNLTQVPNKNAEPNNNN